MKSDTLDTKDVGLSRTRLARVGSVERVISHIHGNLDEPQSLQTLAEIAAMSPFHFNRVFRQVTGIPPVQFLYAARLEAAKRLVLTTSLDVTEICFHVGYNSLGTFVSRFTQLVGVSPGKLRRIAMNFDLAGLRQLCAEKANILPLVPQRSAITGRVEILQDFSGLIFLGLFDTTLPHSRPLSCNVLTEPGLYAFGPVPDGDYHLFAAGLPWADTSSGFLLQEARLRGSSGLLRIRKKCLTNDELTNTVDLLLNDVQPTDPPMLALLPVMLSARLAWSPVTT